MTTSTAATRPSDQLPERTTEERTAVVLRLCVVLAAVVLIVLRPELAGERVVLATVLIGLTAVYAAVLAATSVLRGTLPVRPAVLTGLDGVLGVVACWLTGGLASPMVATLPLVVIAIALRGGDRVGRAAALALGAGYTAAALFGSATGTSLLGRVVAGVWWTGFLFATAVLVGVLVRLLERQLADIATTRARAESEHERYLSERELRDRIVSQSRARLDGARVVLHEFRTPVASLTALSADLAQERLTGDAARTASRLLADHAAHLQDMLDGLADLAVADGSPLGRNRPRRIPLADLADAVLDSAGISAERRRPVVTPPDAAVHCDPQRLRRLLTNLAENAARHSGDEPVDLHLAHDGATLTAEVRDRGPGLPEGQEGVVTAKGVALGERRGTAGLGLWIAEALASAMDGELSLLPRDGGGLTARLTLPLPPA
ncbi:histidine kinase [Pseudonocardia sp. EC080610-09]|uniref:sensor histidine kinase n=1 Tax=unclassified Pseudonocardia TaxID=2619320 RepID=UPI0006CAF70B|nr:MULTISPECIES: HAMP domain-containing sensor histidine kinase [unclassified Pseudonocardia]ALE72155.1 histidine kinase [Pseudonocardia sp. EC080625-04]ALL75440.1 histidine kinase [Pseudonocardia sp. EC080610-09]ALL82466.1 histidine kinase [Pseudonocardia sp. EC080619-01]